MNSSKPSGFSIWSRDDIDVVVHRESIVHSLIEYKDHSVIAQLGVPVAHPHQYALTYPRRFPSPVKQLIWLIGRS